VKAEAEAVAPAEGPEFSDPPEPVCAADLGFARAL